jgi:hypothetical protein
VAAEQQNAVGIEILDRARRTEALEVFGRRIGMEASASRMARSSSSSVVISWMRISGYRSTNSPRRGVSQCTPIPTVVVTLRSPCGRSRLSVSLARAASSFMNTSCAVR